MAFESGLRAFLLTDSGLQTAVAGRVYPLQLPQDTTLPAITYQRISTVRDHAMEAPMTLPDARFQFDVWADNYLASKSIAELVRKKLNGYKGAAGGEEIQGAFLDSERDFYEKVSDITDIYRVSMDFMIWYRETP